MPPNSREAIKVGVGGVHCGPVAVSNSSDLCVRREIATRARRLQPLQRLHHVGFIGVA